MLQVHVSEAQDALSKIYFVPEDTEVKRVDKIKFLQNVNMNVNDFCEWLERTLIH